MSHFTKITAEIKDLEALRSATEKMGFTLVANAPCRYYSGAPIKDYVIKLPGKYDIAINEKNGTFNLEADFWKGYVSTYVGNNGCNLLKQYSIEKAKIEAFQRGLTVTEEEDGENTILTLTDQESGGQIFITCKPGGDTEVKTSGFQGQSCMQFRDIELALGATEDIQHTADFYLPDKETAVETINTSVD